MARSAMIRARVEPDLKHRAETTLEQLGLNATSAITLFYRQIVHRRGLPFDVRLPNGASPQSGDGDGTRHIATRVSSKGKHRSKPSASLARSSRRSKKRNSLLDSEQ